MAVLPGHHDAVRELRLVPRARFFFAGELRQQDILIAGIFSETPYVGLEGLRKKWRISSVSRTVQTQQLYSRVLYRHRPVFLLQPESEYLLVEKMKHFPKVLQVPEQLLLGDVQDSVPAGARMKWRCLSLEGLTKEYRVPLSSSQCL
jgi:hypothetical protein